jgi:hypothetical protein
VILTFDHILTALHDVIIASGCTGLFGIFPSIAFLRVKLSMSF